MVHPTFIILALQLLCKNDSWASSALYYMCMTTYHEVWHNMSPVDGRSNHSLVGMHIVRLHDTSLIFFNFFILLRQHTIFSIFSLLHIPECFCILLELELGEELGIAWIIAFYLTFIKGDVVQVPLGILILLAWSHSLSQIFPRWVNISLLLSPLDWYCLL